MTAPATPPTGRALAAWATVGRIELAEHGDPPEVLARFDVRLFGAVNVRGCRLQRDGEGRLTFAEPGSAGRRRGKPVVVFGSQLRAAIIRRALAAYGAMLAEDGEP